MEKRKNVALIALFCGFLAAFCLMYLFLPKKTTSEKEKRVLAAAPELSAQSLFDGSFEEDAETWFADHAPLRDELVGLQAYYDLASGRNGVSGTILGRNDTLFAAPDALDEAAIGRKCARISELQTNTDLPCTLMLIPTHGYIEEEKLPALHADYHDAALRDCVARSLGEDVSFLWPEDDFRASGEKLYYSTDHHLTSRGSYEAAKLYLASLGRKLPDADAYVVQTVPSFYGSQYAKAGLWGVPGEDMELWRLRDQGPVTVSFDDAEPSDSMFFEEQLEGMDKYSAFLNGNHALVTIETGKTGGGSLLMIRDSFGHCFAPFCAAEFEKIVLVDPRYYRESISALAEREGVDRILVLYGASNFMTDTNIARIR